MMYPQPTDRVCAQCGEAAVNGTTCKECGLFATPEPMTVARRRALAVLANAKGGVLRPADFARRMWPESPGWLRTSRKGAKAVGLIMQAGRMLNGMRDRTGWVASVTRPFGCDYRITASGRLALAQANCGQKAGPDTAALAQAAAETLAAMKPKRRRASR